MTLVSSKHCEYYSVTQAAKRNYQSTVVFKVHKAFYTELLVLEAIGRDDIYSKVTRELV